MIAGCVSSVRRGRSIITPGAECASHLAVQKSALTPLILTGSCHAAALTNQSLKIGVAASSIAPVLVKRKGSSNLQRITKQEPAMSQPNNR